MKKMYKIQIWQRVGEPMPPDRSEERKLVAVMKVFSDSGFSAVADAARTYGIFPGQWGNGARPEFILRCVEVNQ